MHPVIINYSVEEFPFHQHVAEHFSVDNLAYLHCWVDDYERFSHAEAGQDQKTPWHEHFYKIGTRFHDLYRRFLEQVCDPKTGIINAGEHVLFQKVPTFRVQRPGDRAVGGRMHRDGDYGHLDGEINILLPLTPMFGTNSLFIESKSDLGDFSLINLNPGQCFVFDGRNCRHGNYVNQTGVSRVSLDFRVLPDKKYKESRQKSVSYGLRFAEGEYYDRLF